MLALGSSGLLGSASEPENKSPIPRVRRPRTRCHDEAQSRVCRGVRPCPRLLNPGGVVQCSRSRLKKRRGGLNRYARRLWVLRSAPEPRRFSAPRPPPGACGARIDVETGAQEQVWCGQREVAGWGALVYSPRFFSFLPQNLVHTKRSSVAVWSLDIGVVSPHIIYDIPCVGNKEIKDPSQRRHHSSVRA